MLETCFLPQEEVECTLLKNNTSFTTCIRVPILAFIFGALAPTSAGTLHDKHPTLTLTLTKKVLTLEFKG